MTKGIDDKRINVFCKQHELEFKDRSLLIRALTHSSYVNEHRTEDLKDNERLEFLGDAVLELAMSRYLFLNLPDVNEGVMTKRRAQYVCEPSLELYANKINLGKLIRLGKGEEHTGGRKRPAILADAFEALLGAIYLDLGFDQVYDFLGKVAFPAIKAGTLSHVMDYKSKLQELVQTDSARSVTYLIVDEIGPAHNKTFVAEVSMDEIKMGVGEGHSKKEAEQNAAKIALEKMASEQSHK
ncbi:Ribonuclease 3 protein [Haloplasma contractile SSD-17B]|uniref:Ribonuclease 3 n=1 Tax=Haloplasma contractile SSD-17B TaxID=1033810 RepID=U2DYW9_9MOLU|nr:ribonuclease III [Haloplasma contractile]ERJ13437.1 Ribonuclease 3 protein [Haloplasma contractile SSD-17B]